MTALYNASLGIKAGLPIYFPKIPSSALAKELGYDIHSRSGNYTYIGQKGWRRHWKYKREVLIQLLAIKTVAIYKQTLWFDGTRTDSDYVLLVCGLIDKEWYIALKDNSKIQRNIAMIQDDKSKMNIYNSLENTKQKIYKKMLAVYTIKQSLIKIQVSCSELQTYVVDIWENALKIQGITEEDKKLMNIWKEYASDLRNFSTIESVENFFKNAYENWKYRTGEREGIEMILTPKPLEAVSTADNSKLSEYIIDIMQGNTIGSKSTNVQFYSPIPIYEQFKTTNFDKDSKFVFNPTTEQQQLINIARNASSNNLIKEEKVAEMLDSYWVYNPRRERLDPLPEFRNVWNIVPLTHTETSVAFFAHFYSKGNEKQEVWDFVVEGKPADFYDSKNIDECINDIQNTGRVKYDIPPSRKLLLSKDATNALKHILDTLQNNFMEYALREVFDNIRLFQKEEQFIIPSFAVILNSCVKVAKEYVVKESGKLNDIDLTKHSQTVNATIFNLLSDYLQKERSLNLFRLIIKYLLFWLKTLRIKTNPCGINQEVLFKAISKLDSAFKLSNSKENQHKYKIKDLISEASAYKITINGSIGKIQKKDSDDDDDCSDDSADGSSDNMNEMDLEDIHQDTSIEGKSDL